MLFKTPRQRREFFSGDLDARVVVALRYLDAMISDVTRATLYHVEEIVLTSVVRERAEQLAINQRRKGQGGRWAEIDIRWQSLHEVGGAADVRIRDWPSGAAREAAELLEAMFPEIQAIVESDHLHIELREVSRDPREPWRITSSIVRRVRVRFEPAEAIT